jgi:threonine aldolase
MAQSKAAGTTGAAPAASATEERLREARARCTRFLHGHGDRTAAEMLRTIAPDAEIDHYGQGGVVAELEEEVAALLGKEAALFVPSGTMAQQAALRVHADRRGRRTVVFHPACHLDTHEERGYERLHGLHGVPAGPRTQPLSLARLEAIAEAPAALLIELPQRHLGGTLPTWDELTSQAAWARGRGAAVHLDGARLWETTPFYGRTPAAICALFDTVYVSFYKGLGAITGCCVAGPADVVAEISEWRTRHGGRLYGLWPYAASALTCLRERLPRMPAYHAHAVAIAEALRGLPGVTVVPDPPQATMMHILVAATAQELEVRALTIAERDRVWTGARPFASETPALQRLELAVGEATLGFTPSEVRALVAALAGA